MFYFFLHVCEWEWEWECKWNYETPKYFNLAKTHVIGMCTIFWGFFAKIETFCWNHLNYFPLRFSPLDDLLLRHGNWSFYPVYVRRKYSTQHNLSWNILFVRRQSCITAESTKFVLIISHLIWSNIITKLVNWEEMAIGNKCVACGRMNIDIRIY